MKTEFPRVPSVLPWLHLSLMLILILSTGHRQLQFYTFSVGFRCSLGTNIRFRIAWRETHPLGPEGVSAEMQKLSPLEECSLKPRLYLQGWDAFPSTGHGVRSQGTARWPHFRYWFPKQAWRAQYVLSNGLRKEIRRHSKLKNKQANQNLSQNLSQKDRVHTTVFTYSSLNLANMCRAR